MVREEVVQEGSELLSARAGTGEEVLTIARTVVTR